MIHEQTFDLRRDQIISMNDRLHHHKQARRARDLRTLGFIHGRGRTMLTEPAIRHVIIGWPDNRRRDAENLAPTAKHLTDGLVDSGWIADDDGQHIIESRWSSHVHGKRGVYLVTIRLEVSA